MIFQGPKGHKCVKYTCSMETVQQNGRFTVFSLNSTLIYSILFECIHTLRATLVAVIFLLSELCLFNPGLTKMAQIQDYPQKMRLYRRLYRIYFDCLLIFMIPCNCKLVIFFAKSLNKQLIDYIQDSWLSLTLESPYFKGFMSLLKSHPLWITLYVKV